LQRGFSVRGNFARGISAPLTMRACRASKRGYSGHVSENDAPDANPLRKC
jgi:hypothetical protein